MNPALFAANKSAMQRLQILTRLQQDGATSRDKAIAAIRCRLRCRRRPNTSSPRASCAPPGRRRVHRQARL